MSALAEARAVKRAELAQAMYAEPAVPPSAEPPKAGRYDAAQRKRATRTGREKGCWVYIAKDELLAAGIDPDEPPPFYRARGHQRSRNAHAVMVDLYREP